jgi:carbon-monoxide dehydrogenase iron sulfur subunit
MQDKVLVIDHEKCTGCRICELVCSVFHTGASNPSRSRIKVVKWESVGIYLPLTCQSCEKPFCVEVCPAKACHRDLKSGTVLIDKDKCIGCKTCIIACPFGLLSIMLIASQLNAIIAVVNLNVLVSAMFMQLDTLMFLKLVV